MKARAFIVIQGFAALACALGILGGTASASDPGDITALGGSNDYCVTEDGADGDGTPDACIDGKGLSGGVSALQVSPDGRQLHVLGFDAFSGVNGDSIVTLDRSPSRGSLSIDPRINACRSAPASPDCSQGGSQAALLNAPTGIAVSPNSQNVYVSARKSSSITVFDYLGFPSTEDPIGELGPLARKSSPDGCLVEIALAGCSHVRGLANATDVVMSPDGDTVYTSGRNLGGGGVAIFDRASNGVLTQKAGTAGCINDSGGDGCADGNHLEPQALTISSDGKSLYAASQDESTNDAVNIFDINPDGTVTQKAGTAGCFTETDSGGVCTAVAGLGTPADISITPDGKNVYVTSTIGINAGPLTVFDRNTATGVLTRAPGTAGCFSRDGDGGCTEAIGLYRPFTLTATDEAVYVGSSGDGVSVPAALLILNRDSSSGTLTQKPFDGCIATDFVDDCAELSMLDRIRSVAVSPDGDSLYAGSFYGVTVFDRNDGVAPHTTISSGPDGDTTSTDASFTFSADKPNVSYECSIDSSNPGAFQACTSPQVHSNLSLGQHTFRVRATDPFDQVETTPAERTFTVVEEAVPPTCATDASLCPPKPTCKTDPTLCPPDKKVDATVTAARVQKQKGTKIVVTVKVKANEALTAKLSGKVRKGKLNVKFKTVNRKLQAGSSIHLNLRPARRKLEKKLAAALKGGKKSVPKLLITLTDGVQNRLVKKPKVKIKGAPKRR